MGAVAQNLDSVDIEYNELYESQGERGLQER